MHDPKKQERRRRLLKERRAAELRESDQEEARYLSRENGVPHLDPDLYPALEAHGISQLEMG